MCTYQEYWKISDALEVVVSLKTSLFSPKFVGKQYQLAMKYKHSEHIKSGLKLDLAGNIAAGIWLGTKGNLSKNK